MNKHTPGPWMIYASGPTVYALHGTPARNRFSAHVQAGRADDASPQELRANATLMVAAPELLEALQATYDALCISYPLHACDMDERGTILAKARAAIAKATGAQS